jgi:outer membrane lipoprotein carrier protein
MIMNSLKNRIKNRFSFLAIALIGTAPVSLAFAGDPSPAPSAAPSAPAPEKGPVAAGTASPGALAPEKTKETLDKVQAVYEKTTSFQAEFAQEFVATLHNKKTTSAGQVVFQKPGKMSFRYTQPDGNRIVSNGARIRVYEKANAQMYEQPVDKAQYPAALSFLTGSGKLEETFNFELFTGESMKFPGGMVLVGTPKKESTAYKKVLFYVDAKTFQVRRVLILDNQGNKNRFDFNKARINEATKADEFDFEPPPGTTTIKP